MKIFLETKYYIRTNANTVWREDIEAKNEKHEISQACYSFFLSNLIDGAKPVKNKDGSISYTRQNNYNELIEDIITITE